MDEEFYEEFLGLKNSMGIRTLRNYEIGYILSQWSCFEWFKKIYIYIKVEENF